MDGVFYSFSRLSWKSENKVFVIIKKIRPILYIKPYVDITKYLVIALSSRVLFPILKTIKLLLEK